MRIELTGGPVWHLRALARRNSCWRPFRAEIEDWLSEWRPRARQIMLVGPSAGWCIPDSFLRRFDEIVAVEPDHFARPLFSVLHGRSCLHWRNEDFLARADELLAAHPQAAVLFCNFAGQLRFALDDLARVEAEIGRISELLKGRSWASFHELLSGRDNRNLKAIRVERAREGRALLCDFGLGGEWLDHLTGAFLPSDSKRRVIPWRFDSDRLHLVEAGFVDP